MSKRSPNQSLGLFAIKTSLILCFLTLLSTTLVEQRVVYADTIVGAISQRIGNYDMEMKTVPQTPVVNTNSRVQLRIGSVEGDELVDVPIVIRISKGGEELTRTNPISVMYGHYIFPYKFNQTGVYSLDVDVYDTSYNNQNITFTFPITVNSPFMSFFTLSQPVNFELVGIVLVAISIVSGVAGTIYIRRKKAHTLKS
ncbi:MAG TPA: hypothetical protein VH415_03335 [Nitrososphaeraceae archaeon]|jgi:hypothetical protein